MPPTDLIEAAPLETVPVSRIAVAPLAVAPLAVIKAVITIVSTIKSYYDYLTAPDLDALARQLAAVQRQVDTLRTYLAELRELLYRDSKVEIEAKVSSAEEDFGIYLRTKNESYLISAKASAIEALQETQGKPYTWYSEIDTYLRATAIRIKWYQVAEATDPTLVEIRKAEMRQHRDYLLRLLNFLSATAEGLVTLEERIEWDTGVKPPVKYQEFEVQELDEFGTTVPGTLRTFTVPKGQRSAVLREATAYQTVLLDDLKIRFSIPNLRIAADRCAALT